MNKQQQMNKIKFQNALCEIAKENGKELDILQAIKAAEYIHRAETSLNRLACMECGEECEYNYFMRYYKDKRERIEKRIEKYIRDTIGAECYTQRDPRGYCVRIYTKKYWNVADGETMAANW